MVKIRMSGSAARRRRSWRLPLRGSIMRAALLIAILSMLSASVVAGQQAIPNGIARSGTLSFDARATAGDFTGATQTLSGQFFGAPDLSGITGWVESPVNTLITGNGRRDRDLNKSMESDKFPAMRFELERLQVDSVRADTTLATLHGRFIIHGVTREISFPARVHPEADGWRLRADLPMNLKDYGIKGLSKMLGILKMNELIQVHVDLLFGP